MKTRADQLHADLWRSLLEIRAYARVIADKDGRHDMDVPTARSLAAKIVAELHTTDGLIDELRERETKIGALRHILEGI